MRLLRFQSAVGVYWDFDSKTLPSNVNADVALFAGRIFEIAKSYNSSGYINVAKIYLRGNIDGSLEPKLRNVGYEVGMPLLSEFQAKILLQLVSHTEGQLHTDILFWLWDLERSQKYTRIPCIILVTSTYDHTAILGKFRDRNVCVICVSTFDDENPMSVELRGSCSSSIDFRDVPGRAAAAMDSLAQQGYDGTEDMIAHMGAMGRIASGDEMDHGSFLVSAQASSSVGSSKGPAGMSVDEQWHNFTSRSSSSDDHGLSSASFVPSKEVQLLLSRGDSDDPNDGETLTSEQRTLHDEFVAAVYAYNVKDAVATLRKIYNKQTRCFRIHTVLAVVLPDTAAMAADGREDLLCVAVSFALDCIQWTLGVQKGENVESFKYKMNLNIARWILREMVRKGVPDPAPPAVMGAVEDLVEHILECVVEPEFAWELLISLHVPNPSQRLVPHLLIWRSSRDPQVEARLNGFLYEHKEFASIIPPSQSQMMQFRHGEHGKEWTSSHAGAMHVPHSTPLPPLAGMTSAGQPYGHGGRPTCSPGSPEDLTLEECLLRLLARSVKGELGARIPALYRDEYGEPLRLRGRKLKDILLGE